MKRTLLAVALSALITPSVWAETYPTYHANVTVRSIYDRGRVYDVVFETPDGVLFTVQFKSETHLPLWIGLRAQIAYQGTEWKSTYTLLKVVRK